MICTWTHGEGRVPLEVVVESVEFSGATYIVYAKLGNTSIRAELPRRVEAGAPLTLFFDPARVHLFDPFDGSAHRPSLERLAWDAIR